MGYQDRDWLHEQYVEKDRTMEDIGEECNVSHSTISRWVDKHGLESRGPGAEQADGPYKDKEWLRDQYLSKRNSSVDIAAECGVGKGTILYWLRKFDIPIRDSSEATEVEWEGADERREEVAEVLDNSVNHCSYFMNDAGYMIASDSYKQVRLHRLVAVADYGFDFVAERDVHHRIGVPWLNFGDNLVPVTSEQHRRAHN